MQRALLAQKHRPLSSSSLGRKVLFVLDSVDGNLSQINWDDMVLENSHSLGAAANRAISFTDLAIDHFAAHAYSPGVKRPFADNLHFYVHIPLSCAMRVDLGINPDECIELLLHRMFGTPKDCPCVDDEGETVKKKKIIRRKHHQQSLAAYSNHDQSESVETVFSLVMFLTFQ